MQTEFSDDMLQWGGDSSADRVWDWKARHNTDVGATKDFSCRVSFQCRLSLQSISNADSLYSCGVYTALCINICVNNKNHKHWQPYLCLNTWKYYMKTASHRTGVAAALLAAVPYPGKATQITRKEYNVQFVLIKNVLVKFHKTK